MLLKEEEGRWEERTEETEEGGKTGYKNEGIQYRSCGLCVVGRVRVRKYSVVAVWGSVGYATC